MSAHRRLFRSLSILVIFTMLFSGFPLPSAAARQGPDGVERQVNPQTGKVSFIRPEHGQVLPAADALGVSTPPQDPSMALAKRFGPDFGLKDPERDLKEMRSDRSKDGRITARYQQSYEGIPVLGGELIVNTNENGDLYAMNGEVSPALSLSPRPRIDSERAQEIALQSMGKWYQKMPEDFLASEPALWIYDESLLRASTRPAELVWRMDVTPKDAGAPIRELVLVNAHTGGISLHFNQIDTAWKTPLNSELRAKAITDSFSEDHMPALLGAVWYVATTGDDSNSCSSAGSPCQTITAAIGKASEGDTIRVAMGTYTAPGTDVVFVDKSVTLSGGWNTAFSARTGYSAIDGQNVKRGIYVSSVTAVVENFIIFNSVGNVPGSVWGGGAIRNQGNLTINNSTISYNNFGRASLIYNAPDAVFVLQNSTISYNGGAESNTIVENEGTFTSYGSVVERNTGATTGSITIVMNKFGVMTLVDTAIRDNVGTSIWSNGTLTLTRSLISGNIPAFGTGGIGIGGGKLTVENTTISGNQSPNGGAGLMIGGASTVTINSSTITGNRSDNGNSGSSGGISVDDSGNNVTLKNSIVAKNTEYTAPDCLGPILSAGYNLIGNSSGCSFSATASDQVGTDADPIDPQLGPLGDHGGPTFTHPLLTESPAIDAGNPAAPGSGGNACPVTDQRNIPRPAGTRCDIGAFEGSEEGLSFPLILTYSAEGGTALNETLLCTQSTQPCTGFDPYADAAHFHALGTYNLFLTKHNRNSLDNKGRPILSTVHYDDNGFGYENAAWNPVWGGVMYGGGYGWPLADDVVAHEITHGVTQYASNLFYYYQSGAINESFSDLWGEYYDQTNGMGTDTAGANWQLGEDVSGLSAIRSMSDPPAFDDPDKMSSVHYYEGDEDSGGVHTNSGINNKAAYLMVDGGTFNGKTVSALGWDKTAAIYYEVNTNLLSSGADYSDLYYALQQACTNLIGQDGITSGDCAEVKEAIDAVEMNAQPAPNFNTEAPYCPIGDPVTTVFADDLEAGAGNWTIENVDYIRWQLDAYFGPFAHSGKHSLYAADSPARITDATARLAAVTVPENAYLRFAQAYGFESGYNPGDPTLYHFDGGVLEYSVNDGASWEDAGSLIDYNGYEGEIFTGAGNPLSGRSAFVNDSHGYISTRLNLNSLAGQTISFRWRMGLDEAVSEWGWWVDDIEVYTCEPQNLKVFVAGALQESYYVLPHKSTRVSYAGVNKGPVSVASTNNSSILAAERVVYKVNNVPTSFSEMMGLPDSQVDTTYWLPWYNNKDLNTQLRIANVSAADANVQITIGGVSISSFTLPAGKSTRKSFPGIDKGAVKIESDQDIVAAERVIYRVNGVDTSFSEMMAMPESQLDTVYWLPWYNSKDLDTQLRIANVSTSDATVHVSIGSTPVTGSPFIIPVGQSIRKSFPGHDRGPVKIESNVDIVASERVIYKVNNVPVSFSEMMALPNSQLDTTYWLPWYNSKDLNTQLRIANVSGSTATVHIRIRGVEVTGSPFTIPAGASKRLTFPGIDKGPVQIESDVDVVAAERVIYTVNGKPTSFSEMMGLPNHVLDTIYWLPWYNNKELDTQLRFGIP